MKPAKGELHVFDDVKALARHGAEWLTARAAASAGRFVVALSGGSTPKPLYEYLAQPPLRERFPWARTELVLGDERFVPETDPASNLRMIRQAMLDHVPLPADHMHAVATASGTPEEAATDYDKMLRSLYGADQLRPDRMLLDVCLLGLGDDGHTASLIPGEPVLAERSRWVAAVGHGRSEPRVTLTYPALESSGAVVFLVSGDGKRAMLDHVLSGGQDVPAGRLQPQGEVFWFVDRAAAGRWAA
jgi:6-phosphogluconolactonase